MGATFVSIAGLRAAVTQAVGAFLPRPTVGDRRSTSVQAQPSYEVPAGYLFVFGPNLPVIAVPSSLVASQNMYHYSSTSKYYI